MNIAVASGKGGTGKTFVSTNLFYVFKSMGASVSMVDCDAEVPNSLIFLSAKECKTEDINQYLPTIDSNKCKFCGKCVEYCNYNAIFLTPELKKIQLLEDLCHGCGACQVACSEHAIRESCKNIGVVNTYKVENKKCFVEGRMNTGESSSVPIIKTAIKRAEKLKTDFLIMDSPPGTSCPFIQTVAQANFTLLVTEPTPFGLSDLKQATETLRTMNKSFAVVINRAGIGDSKIYDYLEKENISLFAEIPFRKDIAKYYSEGIIVSERLTEIKVIFESIVNKLKLWK